MADVVCNANCASICEPTGIGDGHHGGLDGFDSDGDGHLDPLVRRLSWYIWLWEMGMGALDEENVTSGHGTSANDMITRR